MSDIVQEWCDSYPMCRGCKYHGNECVTADEGLGSIYWQDRMEELILEESGAFS